MTLRFACFPLVALAGAAALAAPLTLPVSAAPVKTAASVKAAASAPVVRMTTTRGVILIKLYPKDAPITCANGTCSGPVPPPGTAVPR